MQKKTGLTRKQKAFADKLIADPKLSATRAVEQTYNVKNKKTATVIATENLAKPSIRRYLDLHADKARDNLLELEEFSRDASKTFSKEGASYGELARKINESIIDRTDGRPTQRTEVKSTRINISLGDILDK